VELDDIPGRIL